MAAVWQTLSCTAAEACYRSRKLIDVSLVAISRPKLTENVAQAENGRQKFAKLNVCVEEGMEWHVLRKGKILFEL